jgi:hypothetical protein
MINNYLKLMALFLMLIFTTGCVSFSDRSFRPVKRDIAAQLPELTLKKEFAMSMGSAMFNTIDFITIGSDFDFSSIDKVQIAVYEMKNTSDLRSLDVERSLMARNPDLNWQTVVKVRELDEYTWVMMGLNSDGNRIEALSILVMEQDELVLINVNGELEKMIEFAFEPIQGERGSVNFS